MTAITLSVPEELKKKMDQFRELNWSEIARQAFKQKIEDLEFMREFTSRSKMTQADALRLGAKVSKKLAKRYLSSKNN